MSFVPIVLLLVAIAISVGIYKLKYDAKVSKQSVPAVPVDAAADSDSPDKKSSVSLPAPRERVTRERPVPEDTSVNVTEEGGEPSQTGDHPPPRDPSGSLGASLRSLFRG